LDERKNIMPNKIEQNILDKVAKTLDELETEYGYTLTIGCILILDAGNEYSWNGEKFTAIE
jgi:hypothetical protein